MDKYNLSVQSFVSAPFYREVREAMLMDNINDGETLSALLKTFNNMESLQDNSNGSGGSTEQDALI